jgi:aryl-alcohol dehydrogenase-like predicted oxidoreductase
MGECGKEESEKILDYFYESGGNFIDTSNNYQKEESEIWIGEWMKKRNIRDQLVIATKFTTYDFLLLVVSRSLCTADYVIMQMLQSWPWR